MIRNEHWLIDPHVVRYCIPGKFCVWRHGVVAIDMHWSILNGNLDWQTGCNIDYTDFKKHPCHTGGPRSEYRWQEYTLISILLVKSAAPAHPPFNQIPHGSVLVFDVNEPFWCSKAQKKRVSLGWSARRTGRFPAKLRVKGNVTFGSGSMTSKSISDEAKARI